MSWRNRIIGHEDVDPEQLLANPGNWRIHPQAQQVALSTALNTVGIVQSVIVNQRTGFVVDGHLRVSMALRTGQPSIPVTYVDLSDSEERLILASLDSITGMAVPDREILAELLDSIDREDEAVDALLMAVECEALPVGGEDSGTPQDSRNGLVTCPECGHEFSPPHER